ncbi:hypothetical protein HPP92_006140 [Vanilla planifolia]|uniref:Uncharacterized protein n=1 Tax=Vanilla planifolia TaxID=51239 RepID=A0A835VBL5_VANPL|nr:hypothetical protein HPP92_006140 [Vanilla planifolia]
MGRQPCCEKVGLKKGPWTPEEDKKLITFLLDNGQCCWRAVPKLAGLLRCGKSCRLRWTNYLRPDLKRGLLSEAEEKLVIDLHSQLGNRWSKIAARLPGRTDNEIKNYWNTHIKKKLKKMGIDPITHMPLVPEDQLPASATFSTKEIVSSCLSSSSSTTTIGTTWSFSPTNSSVKVENNQLESMEWPESDYLWGMDDFMRWHFVSKEGEGELKCPDPSNQLVQEESWKVGLF